jgi:DNA-binding transcriptional ArsR family regulator
MGRMTLTPELYRLLSERFKALSEPARLQILYVLQGGRELSVNELVEETGLGQANVSKHLQVLHSLGFVKRRKDGLYVHYAHADRNVMKLCELMCGRVEIQLEAQERLLVGS